MPNRVLLVFDPKHHPIEGMKDQYLDPKHSMFRVANEVARKAFRSVANEEIANKGDKNNEGESQLYNWLPYIEDKDGSGNDWELESFIRNVTRMLGSEEEKKEGGGQRAEEAEKGEGGGEVTEKGGKRELPCFAIIDVSLFLYLDDDSNSRVKVLRDWLTTLANAECPVFLVSTVPAPTETRKVLEEFESHFVENIHLARADSNIWDALYNLIKRGEHDSILTKIGKDPKDNETVVEWPENRKANLIRTQFSFHHRMSLQRDSERTEVSTAIVIRNQVFEEKVIISEADFKGSVIFENCEFKREFVVRNCKFENNLHFFDCTFQNDCTIELTAFSHRAPWFYKCQFVWRFYFRRNSTPDAYAIGATPTMMFSRSHFNASNRINMPYERLRISFYSCILHDGEYTEINWPRDQHDQSPPIGSESDFPEEFRAYENRCEELNKVRPLPQTTEASGDDDKDSPQIIATKRYLRRFYDRRKDEQEREITADLDIYVRLINCDIAGRLVLRENPPYSRFYRDPSRCGLMLSLEGSTVRGMIDLTEIRIRWLDVEGTTFSTGGIIMNEIQVKPRKLSFGTNAGWLESMFRSFWGMATTSGLLFILSLFGLSTLVGEAGWLDNFPWLLFFPVFVFATLAVLRLSTPCDSVLGIDAEGESDNENRLCAYDFQRDKRKHLKHRFFNLAATPAEHTGLVYEELILAAREKWRFADAIGSRRYWESPQATLTGKSSLSAAAESSPSTATERGSYLQSIYSSVAQQYENLRSAFAKSPSAAAESSPSAATERGSYQQSIYSSVAQQYENLRSAFANSPATDHLEDFCHYKALTYRTMASNEGIPARAKIAVRLFLIVVLVWITASFWLGYQPPDDLFYRIGVGIVSFLSLPLGILAFVIWRSTALKTAMINAVSDLLLKKLLAYGVYPSRVFVTTCGVIVAYAFIYIVSCSLSGEQKAFGHILDQKNTALSYFSGELHWLETTADCFYYSAVTFTTLGYGDMRPQGFMRFVSASEAFVGAAMIAFITVSVVRRFLRR